MQLARTSLVLILLLLFSILNSSATDRYFTYTYESRTLQRGLRELETWVTYKYGREDFYSALENRLEFEVGLGKRLQTSFYLNLNAATSPFTYTVPSFNSSGELVLTEQTDLRTQFNVGFSNEWKYQLSDPSTNKIGSALYGEIGISPNEYELEMKIILDKHFSYFVTAFNAVGEIEFENEIAPGEKETEWEHEYEMEFDYGLAYLLNDRWSLGAEIRNHNDIVPEQGWENAALFIGPTVSYKSENWWVTLTALPQITNLKGGGLDLDEHEKINARLLFSYSF